MAPFKPPQYKETLCGKNKLALVHTEQEGAPLTCLSWRGFVPSTCRRANRPATANGIWTGSIHRLAHALLFLACCWYYCHGFHSFPCTRRVPPLFAPPTLAGVWAAGEQTGRTCSNVPGLSPTLLSREQNIYTVWNSNELLLNGPLMHRNKEKNKCVHMLWICSL